MSGRQSTACEWPPSRNSDFLDGSANARFQGGPVVRPKKPPRAPLGRVPVLPLFGGRQRCTTDLTLKARRQQSGALPSLRTVGSQAALGHLRTFDSPGRGSAQTGVRRSTVDWKWLRPPQAVIRSVYVEATHGQGALCRLGLAAGPSSQSAGPTGVWRRANMRRPDTPKRS